jgi:iron complex outermembrane receptor protein
LAIFGQATIELGEFAQALDTVALKLGGRYSWEERQTANPAIILAGGGAGPIIHYTTEATFNERTFKDFTPEIGVEWRPLADVMFYYNYAEGFKAGAGENSAGSSTIVDPEQLDSHEIGMKSTFWNGRATASVAAFTYDLKGLQINRTFSGGPAGFSTSFENAAQTSAEGIEVELGAQITSQFRVNGALSYLDSEFDDFMTKDPFKAENIAAPGNPQFDPTLPPEQLAGNPTRNSPEFAANLHAEYDILGLDLPYNGFLTASGEMSPGGPDHGGGCLPERMYQRSSSPVSRACSSVSPTWHIARKASRSGAASCPKVSR